MDAHAHLLSLGWAGPGHSLDSRPYKQKGHRGLAYDPKTTPNDGLGLVKPLLASKRTDRLGIGKKSHEPPAGSEWWLKGFETALGNIGKSESERTSGTSTPASGSENKNRYRGKHEGLYGCFVKGQGMEGTISDSMDEDKRRKKRKSEEMDVVGSSSDDRDSHTQQAGAVAEFVAVEAFLAARDKDKTRSKRDAKADAIAQFRQVGEFLEARSGEKKKKRRSDIHGEEATLDGPEQAVIETKEERRARRRRQKEEKHSLHENDAKAADAEDASTLTERELEVARKARKAARKRKKEEREALAEG